MDRYKMTKKELSVWAYLNEVEFYLENGQYEHAIDFIVNARNILSGSCLGDFEDGFLEGN